MTFGDTARAEVRPASSLYEVLLDARYGESE